MLGNNIVRLFIKRLAQCVFVVLIVGFLSFSMFRYIGDPVVALVNINETSPEEIEALRESLGLNVPFYVQYFSYLARFLKGNFGNSYQYKIPVLSLIVTRVPATLELALFSFFFAVVIGILVGVHTSIYPNKHLSRFFTFSSSLGISVPSFIIGIFLIYTFSVTLPVFPSFGRGDTVMLGTWETNFLSIGGFRAIILPAITLGTYQFAFVQRVVHAEMTNVLKTEFVRYAYIRGIQLHGILFKHAFLNVVPTLISIVIIQLGGLIAFASITESVFQWQGLGFLFIESLQRADIPVLSIYLMFTAILFVILNFIADVLLIVIDPRVRK